MKLQDFQLNLQILIDYVNFCCGNDMTKFYDKTKTNKLFSKKFFKSKVSLKVKNLVEKNNKLVLNKLKELILETSMIFLL